MAHEVMFGVSGMVLLAAAMWLIQSRSLRTKASVARAVILCVGGVAVIAMAAIQAGSSWILRLAIFGPYSAAGAFLGLTIVNVLAKSRAGTVLASLESDVPTRIPRFLLPLVTIAVLGIGVQFIYGLSRLSQGLTQVLFGPSLFSLTSSINMRLLTRNQWLLAERGIIGPNVFVPWQLVLAYDWQDSHTLGIATTPWLGGARRFTVSVAPEARERVAAILASKVPRQVPGR